MRYTSACIEHDALCYVAPYCTYCQGGPFGPFMLVGSQCQQRRALYCILRNLLVDYFHPCYIDLKMLLLLLLLSLSLPPPPPSSCCGRKPSRGRWRPRRRPRPRSCHDCSCFHHLYHSSLICNGKVPSYVFGFASYLYVFGTRSGTLAWPARSRVA